MCLTSQRADYHNNWGTWLKQLFYEKQQQALKDIWSIFGLSLIAEDMKLNICPDPAMVCEPSCISLYNRCQKDFVELYTTTVSLISSLASLRSPRSSFPVHFRNLSIFQDWAFRSMVASGEDWGGGGQEAERERISPPPCSSSCLRVLDHIQHCILPPTVVVCRGHVSM